jgi:signal transduction histidine kinase
LKKKKQNLLRKLNFQSSILILFWTACIAISLLWNMYQQQVKILEIARNHAQVTFDNDILYRKWAASQGGLYVPVSESVQPNPYLKVANRDIMTTTGQVLTLVNPAYMTRQVFQTGRNGEIRGHLTSLKPIRPENGPDRWETAALASFETGSTEASSVENMDSGKNLRLMHPFITEKACLKCHGAQGYKVGDIRGGISVSVPLEPLWAIERPHTITLWLAHGCFWLLGITGIMLSRKGLGSNMLAREKAERDMSRSLSRLSLLERTAGELLQSSEPQKVVERLCSQVMEHLDCQAFFNFLVDDTEGRLHLNACAGIPAEEVRRIEWLDYGTAVCGCAARDCCRIVAEHIPTTPDPRTELVKSYGIKAYACHPLLGRGGKVIGTLSFGTKTRETFSDEDLALMKAVANHVASAMTRLQDEKALRKLNEELEKRVAERTAIAEQRAQQLRQLASELTHAEQKERKRLANLLHDHLQQILAAAKLKAALLENVISDETVKPALKEVINLLCEAVTSSRTLSVELSPPVLNDSGLTSGLKWLASWMNEKYGLHVNFKANREVRDELPEEIKLFVFDAVREMLSNVVKHSRVSVADLKLTLGRGALYVGVKDSGIGMESNRVITAGGGLGIFSIQERVSFLGGRLKVTGRPGYGTLIAMRIPVTLPNPPAARQSA